MASTSQRYGQSRVGRVMPSYTGVARSEQRVRCSSSRQAPYLARVVRKEGQECAGTCLKQNLPTTWFNVVPHLDSPLEPPLHPATRQPLGPDDLAPLFPMALIAQEVTGEPYVDIPGEVLDVLRLWRPTPLVRATRSRSCPRHAGPHLLQRRVRFPTRLTQAQHGCPSGLLQQSRGHQPPHDRDGGRPMG